tara:strand:+ start:1055 stop:1666 length:612 start_codon:yes stop_codon:yes gene_type:complete
MSKKKEKIESAEIEFDGSVPDVSDPNEEVQAAFHIARQTTSDEDEVKLKMIEGGATFKNVTRLYNAYMIEAGYSISKPDRDALVEEKLAGLYFDTEETYNAAVSVLTDSISGATERSAASLVRSYAKKNSLDVYAKPKSEGAPRTSFVHKFYEFLAANPSCSESEAHDFIFGVEPNEPTSQNVKNYEKMHQNVRVLANRIAAK